MREEVKNKWVKALRSGEYEQGTGKLHKDGKLCCLGVLCELAKEDLKDELSIYKSKLGYVFYGEKAEVPPTEVRDWSGMDHCQGELKEVVPVLMVPYRDDVEKMIDAKYLTDFNDNGYDFNQIADLIEQNWGTL